jgi:hypothetical protein
MEDEARRHEPGTEGVTGFELLGGAALPLRADLRIEITRGSPDAALAALPPGAAEQLLEQEDRLLGWLEESEENRVAFLTDPVDGLQRAGIELDRDVVEALREVHGRNAAADAMPPGLHIESLKVDVSRHRPCPEDAEPSEED